MDPLVYALVGVLWLLVSVVIFLLIPLVLRCFMVILIHYETLYVMYAEAIADAATPSGMTLSGGDRFAAVFITTVLGTLGSLVALTVIWISLGRPKPAEKKVEV